MPSNRSEAGAEDGEPTASFDLGSLLGYRLLRLSSSIGALADREAGEAAGLSLPEYRVLVVLHSHRALGVVAMQQVMRIDKAWISRTLARLAEKGLVISRPDPTDARRTVFRLTAAGRRSAELLIERALERQRRILRGLRPREVEQLMDLLARVQRNVDETDGPPD